MKDDFDKILDDCIDRINRGKGFDSILADYPYYAEQLRPLLQAMLAAREAYSFVPSPDTKKAARERFNAALEVLDRRQVKRQAWFTGLLGWSRVWATAATVILIAVIGFFVMRPVLFPAETGPSPGPTTSAPAPGPTTSTPTPVPTTTPSLNSGVGMIKVYITDPPPPKMDEIWVDIKNLDVHKYGGGWTTIAENPGAFNLKAIEGIQQYLADQIVEAGKYTQIRLGVNSVRIVVGEDEHYAKVPSENIKLVGNFEVIDNNTTEITLDFNGEKSVLITGKGEYIFKPVIKLLLEYPSPSAPTVTSVAPNSANRGQTLNVAITGDNLTRATAVSFGAGITINSYTVNSGTQVTANITIAVDATLGTKNVSVTTPGGTGTLTNGFTVTAP